MVIIIFMNLCAWLSGSWISYHTRIIISFSLFQCNQLGNNLKDVVDKYKKYDDSSAGLLKWLSSSEEEARSQQSEAISADPQTLQTQLEETKARKTAAVVLRPSLGIESNLQFLCWKAQIYLKLCLKKNLVIHFSYFFEAPLNLSAIKRVFINCVQQLDVEHSWVEEIKNSFI